MIAQVADSLFLPLEDKSVDLVFTSPPYEDARTYGIDFKLKGQAWVDWAVPRFLECLRVCRGLVAWVVEGKTRNYQWSATPALLMADLHRRGVNLRKPPIYMRHGIPGSGGPDWLKNRYEFIVCATHGGQLPWSDNTACGSPPKFDPGGPPSHRMKNGERVTTYRKSVCMGPRTDGDKRLYQNFTQPKLANPGNVIDCGVVGGVNMGSRLCHENEAPFPEDLAEFFVRSFCPPNGKALDPMCGSGTLPVVAERLGRVGIGFDIRQSQIDLTNRRYEEMVAKLPIRTQQVAA